MCGKREQLFLPQPFDENAAHRNSGKNDPERREDSPDAAGHERHERRECNDDDAADDECPACAEH